MGLNRLWIDPLVEAAMQKLSAAADFEVPVTLTPEEASLLIRWIKSEKYRR